MKRFTLLACLLAASCTHHHGAPGTPPANDIILSAMGLPSFGGVQNCPSRNDGDIKLTYDNGQDRVKGECKGGVKVGTWKAWYTNGAVVWPALERASVRMRSDHQIAVRGRPAPVV